MIELQGIAKSYAGREVLSGIDLDVARGELVTLLGPSGCGKTTLLRVLAGFERADRGRVVMDGSDVTRLPAVARRFGMVFQAYSLFPNMTALGNVRFGPRMRGVGRADALSRARRLLALVGLEAHGEKYPHQLSGGQQQRVALARALATEPPVLLLDEPLSALDARVRLQLRDEIRRIQRETGITTVMVTHDQEEALSISDRVAVMHEGRLVQVGAPAAIYRRPVDGFVARFIGAGSVVSGVAASGAVQAGGLALPAEAAAGLPAGSEVELFLRPEHVRVADVAGEGLAAEVREATFLGALTRLRLSLAGGVELRADLAADRAEAFAPGAAVRVAWDRAAPLVLPR